MTTSDDSTTTTLAKASPEAFLLFDRQDDAAVIARIQGAALREMVYAFQQRGATIYGLGIDGAEECKRELARMGEVIRMDEVEIMRETPDEAYFRAKASRWAVKLNASDMLLDTTIELKRQPKFITRRDGSQEPDEFWLEKGGSKASRNAILNLVPEQVKQMVIERFKQQARVVESTPEQVDADVARHHATMDAKEERDKKITDLRDAWVAKELSREQVAAILRGKGLSESLKSRMSDASAWATVDEAVIDEMLAEARA
jgi:hypothetical protein